MTDYDYILASKAAWYYYAESLTQQQISYVLGVSRVKIARLLELARKNGLVKISFRQESSYRMKAESELISSFLLRDAFIIPAATSQSSSIVDLISRAAASYIGARLPDNGFLNIGYGVTTSHILGYLAHENEKHISVVSLTGGVNYYLPTINSDLRSIKLYLIPSPLFLSSPEVRDEMYNEPDIKMITQMSSHADMTVISVGGMTSNTTIINNNILTKNDLTLLRMQGAVGDILSHFIDSKGNPVASSFESTIISTSLNELSSFKNVICVAAGREKIPVLFAALRKKYIDVLITDEPTAEALLIQQAKQKNQELGDGTIEY